MFETEMRESTSSKIIISDIDAETMFVVLEYMYTGKVIMTESISYTGLIYAAEKYDLPQLKRYCFNKMCECATDDTIGSLTLAAHAFNVDSDTKESLKKYCLR